MNEKKDITVDILQEFILDGEPILCRRFGSGHINDTYLVVDDTARIYILQKINQKVFREPEIVMRNISAVTAYLSNRVEDHRNVMELLPTKKEKLWFVDKDGEYWRLYSYISDSVCYQQTRNVEIFRESAAAFGVFQRSLSEFPAKELSETIPRFHDTPNRYTFLKTAIENNVVDRVKLVRKEIEFALNHEAYAATLMNRYADGELPLRVTHNDTKLNNVLFDRRTQKSLCVIDLDTVMPGFSVNDFGDSIRFGASTAAEDERDLDKVMFSPRLFEAYAEGFLSICGKSLTKGELNSLCDAAIIITLETGVRFLTDYLSNDVYFRIHRDNHNLDRCRTQFKLVECMESSFDSMRTVIDSIVDR